MGKFFPRAVYLISGLSGSFPDTCQPESALLAIQSAVIATATLPVCMSVRPSNKRSQGVQWVHVPALPRAVKNFFSRVIYRENV